MRALVSWWIGAMLLSSTANAGEIRMQVRKPLLLLIAVPTGSPGHTSRSELFRMVSDLTRAHTGFRAEPVEAEVIDECEGRIPCLAQNIRAGDRFLFIISNITGAAEGDVLSTILVDADAPDKVAHRSPPTAFGDDIRRRLEALFLSSLRPIFESSGDWEPFGAIEVATGGPGFALMLDGAVLGVTTSSITIIRDVVPGPHTLAVERPGHGRFETPITVTRGESVAASAEMLPPLSPLVSTVRSVVLWSGVGAAVAGTIVMVVAATRSEPDERCLFMGSIEGCAPGSSFRRSGGVLLAPLGYSLFGLGASWSLGTFLTDEREIPWIALVAGVVIGGTAYALSAVLD